MPSGSGSVHTGGRPHADTHWNVDSEHTAMVSEPQSDGRISQ